jgi:membrane protease subunit HflK
MNLHGEPGGFDDEIMKFIQAFKQNFKLIGTVILILVLAMTVKSSMYTVDTEEEAIVLRLGRYINTTPPGLHLKIPFIDKVEKIKTTIVHQAEFGYRTQNKVGTRTLYNTSSFDDESLMLTGDLNVADVEWVVQYKISDPFKYRFKTKDPVRNIRDISESIMRRVVGDKLVTEVLTTGRVEISGNAKEWMQELVDKYEMGISIQTVKLQDVNPPESVKDSFNEVNAARQEQEKVINQAERRYNEIIPEAKGKADKLLSEAEGYGKAKVNKALGDANKFLAVLKEYNLAPDITKKRIYLETMEKIFSNLSDFTVIDPKVKGVIPIFGQSETKKL